MTGATEPDVQLHTQFLNPSSSEDHLHISYKIWVKITSLQTHILEASTTPEWNIDTYWVFFSIFLSMHAGFYLCK